MMEYKYTDINPLAKPEKRSHSKCLMIFFIFMISYYGIAIFAYTYDHSVMKKTHDTSKINENDIKKKDFFKLVDDPLFIINQFMRTDGLDYFTGLSNYFHRSSLNIFMFGAVSLITSIICTLIMRKISSIIMKIMIAINVIMFVLAIVNLLTIEKYEFDIPTTLCVLILNIFCIWHFFNIIYAIYHLGLKLISEVIKESCRAIISSSYIILLPFFSSTLMIFVAHLTFNIYVTLSIIETVDPNQVYFKILKYFNIASGLWIIFFIWNFTIIVCSKIFSIWFYKTYKSSISYISPAESFKNTLRYHMGTVAYVSSPGSIIIFIITTIKNLSNKARETRYNIFVLITCYWNIFWTLYDGSCVMTAMQGTNFKKSADSACQTYLKYPLHLYAIDKGYTWCLSGLYNFFYLIYGFIFINAFTMEDNFFKLTKEDNYNFSISILYLMLPTYLLISSAVSTITICIFKELEFEKQNLIRPSYMNAKIQNLLQPEML